MSFKSIAIAADIATPCLGTLLDSLAPQAIAKEQFMPTLVYRTR